ncbi:hypothetical protein QBC39DRAFT_248639, partial [Podospora conica]
AIRYGDYSVIRGVIPLLPVLFFKGKGIYLYTKPIDLVIKYTNVVSTLYIKYNKNSTYNVDVIFYELSAISSIVAAVCSSVK